MTQDMAERDKLLETIAKLIEVTKPIMEYAGFSHVGIIHKAKKLLVCELPNKTMIVSK